MININCVEGINLTKDSNSVINLTKGINSGRINIEKCEYNPEIIVNIILRLPVSDIYMSEADNGSCTVIKGNQILYTLKIFLENKISIRMNNESILWEDLPNLIKNRIKDCSIRLNKVHCKNAEFLKERLGFDND